jgi:hypothetical protein
MENQLSIGDRLIVEQTEYNPLTDFYLKGISQNEYNVEFGYGVMAGFATYAKHKVKKHPIQKSQFTFSVEIYGNNCNSENPKLNDYSKYLINMNNQALIFRAGLICFREILNSFTDKESKKNAVEDLIEIVNSNDSMISLNSWIIRTIENVPEYFNCKSVIEYSGENAPPIAIYNSERRNNNVVTAVFLVLYTTIMFQVGVLSKDLIIKELKIIKL